MAIGRATRQHQRLTKRSFAGAVKLRCEELDKTLASLAPHVGMQPDSLRARLSKSRDKRALQPWQVSAIAVELALDEADLHRLAARHEGWKV